MLFRLEWLIFWCVVLSGTCSPDRMIFLFCCMETYVMGSFLVLIGKLAMSYNKQLDDFLRLNLDFYVEK